MIKNHYFKLCNWILALLVLSSCQKGHLVEEGGQALSPNEYLETAKVWYKNNRNLAMKREAQLGFSGLEVEWDAYDFTTNSSGDSVIVIPISSQRDTFYREIGLAVNREGIPFGIIKEYLGDPFRENTMLNIYSGGGLLLESALYNHETRTMQYIHLPNKEKGILAWIKNKIACNGCQGNMTDGYTIEEVTVTGYQNNHNHGYYGNPPPIPSPYPQPDPDYYPEIPSGPGGANNSPNDNNNNNDEQNRIDKKKVLEQKRFNDCNAATLADAMAANQHVQNVINNIKNKSVEWGAPIMIADPSNPSAITTGAERTDNNANKIGVSPRWNSYDGYHIGFIHNHPSGSAPSPSDIFNPLADLNTMVSDFYVNDKQVANLISHYTSIVVSGGNVYTITIKNPLYMSFMQGGGYNRDKEVSRYEDLVNKYIDDNSFFSPTPAQYQTAGEYALLKLYSDQVHITKHKIGETNKSEVLKLENNKKVKKEKPCQN